MNSGRKVVKSNIRGISKGSEIYINESASRGFSLKMSWQIARGEGTRARLAKVRKN